MATLPSPVNKEYFQFSTPAGHELCRRIVLEQLGYSPHDYQLEGVCKALDGLDILAVTPTGSGKTGYLVMYFVVARAIVRNPMLCVSPPAVDLRRNPAMVVVCPTLALEDDMVSTLSPLSHSETELDNDTGKEVHGGRDHIPPH